MAHLEYKKAENKGIRHSKSQKEKKKNHGEIRNKVGE
jgi:hypothetical protein